MTRIRIEIVEDSGTTVIEDQQKDGFTAACFVVGRLVRLYRPELEAATDELKRLGEFMSAVISATAERDRQAKVGEQ